MPRQDPPAWFEHASLRFRSEPGENNPTGAPTALAVCTLNSSAAIRTCLLHPGTAALDEKQQHKHKKHAGHDSDNRK